MNDSIHYSNSPYQKIYGRILSWVSNFGLLVLFISFVLYTSGVLKAWIPLDQLPQYWQLPLDEFIVQTDSATGWKWITRLGYGDYLSFVGISILAGVTGICYLVLLVLGARDKKKILVTLVILELILLIIAASDILSVGGH